MPAAKNHALSLSRSQFNRLSNKRKRIEIAKDIIAQIKDKRLVVKAGDWGAVVSRQKNPFEGDLRDFFSRPEFDHCEVCAIGALMVSHVRFCDDFSFCAYSNRTLLADNGNEKIFGKLIKIFGNAFYLIEIAFELGCGSFMYPPYAYGDHDDNTLYASANRYNRLMKNSNTKFLEQAKRAVEFGKRYITERNRMLAIWKNIIDNDGEFTP